MLRLILLLLLISCVKTEVVNEVVPQSDTIMMRKPHKPFPPHVVDTARVAIGFDPSVKDWDEIEINPSDTE